MVVVAGDRGGADLQMKHRDFLDSESPFSSKHKCHDNSSFNSQFYALSIDGGLMINHLFLQRRDELMRLMKLPHRGHLHCAFLIQRQCIHKCKRSLI